MMAKASATGVLLADATEEELQQELERRKKPLSDIDKFFDSPEFAALEKQAKAVLCYKGEVARESFDLHVVITHEDLEFYDSGDACESNMTVKVTCDDKRFKKILDNITYGIEDGYYEHLVDPDSIVKLGKSVAKEVAKLKKQAAKVAKDQFGITDLGEWEFWYD